MGSPPVRTTWRGPLAHHWTSSSTDTGPPSGAHEVLGLSHHTQRRLQPETRTKLLGAPTSAPSPWIETKRSWMRSEVTQTMLTDLHRMY